MPEEAEKESALRQTILDQLRKYGYQLIKTPLLEFEDSLLSEGTGQALQNKTFRVMDPDTHKMMGLRSDVTAQMARIAGSRLKHVQRPLRLMYANDVCRTRTSQSQTSRQFCQLGFELIGADDQQVDIEIFMIALKSLQSVTDKKITLELSLPPFLDKLLSDRTDEDKKKIKDILAMRDEKKLAKLYPDLAFLLQQDSKDWKVTGEAKENLNTLDAIKENLRQLLQQDGIKNITVQTDPIEKGEMQYYTGVAGSLYVEGISSEIGSGGRYNLTQSGETACGFAFYTNILRQAAPDYKREKTISVSAEESWQTIEKLQKEGWIVERDVMHNKTNLDTTHTYKNNEIIEVN